MALSTTSGCGSLEQLRQVASHLRFRREAVNGLRAGRGSDELELRVGSDDLECLPTDRSGRAEQGDSLHPL